MTRPPSWRIGLLVAVVAGLGFVLNSFGVSWRSYTELVVVSVLGLLVDIYFRRRNERAVGPRLRRVPPAKSRR